MLVYCNLSDVQLLYPDVLDNFTEAQVDEYIEISTCIVNSILGMSYSVESSIPIAVRKATAIITVDRLKVIVNSTYSNVSNVKSEKIREYSISYKEVNISNIYANISNEALLLLKPFINIRSIRANPKLNEYSKYKSFYDDSIIGGW